MEYGLLNFLHFFFPSFLVEFIMVMFMAQVSDDPNIPGDNYTWNHDAMEQYIKCMIRDSVPGPQKLETNTLLIWRFLDFSGFD